MLKKKDKEYHKQRLKEFRRQNPTYHRDWMRRKRAGLIQPKKRRVVKEYKPDLTGRCHRCEILLYSLLAGEVKGNYCESCRKEQLTKIT